MRKVMIAWMTVLLVAGAAPAQRAPDPSHLITPGASIGSVRLGMAVSDVTALLGTPSPAQVVSEGTILPAPGGATAYYWPKSGWLVETGRTGIVVDVAVLRSARCSTVDGLHDGLTAAEVRAKWGPPSRTMGARSGNEFLVYDARGAMFLVSRNASSASYGKVLRVDVFKPRTP